MKELIEFCLDTENPEKNYNLAQWYKKQGHISPAHTYYLRAAERTKDTTLAYTCLLNSAECYYKGGNREYTRRHLLENAICLRPERPEAYYYICLHYELKTEWTNCYKHACIALQRCDFEQDSLSEDFQENWEVLLLFMKALSSWWVGKGIESRKLFRTLAFEHWGELSKLHKVSVKNNMMKLGAVPPTFPAPKYTQSDFNRLRYKFKNSETITNNYSQVFQDMFVLSMLDGKKNGTFLEIGGSKPFENNNTALLEQEFEWKGVSIELDESFVQEYMQNRLTTKVLCSNALEIDYESLLFENYKDNIIDYLQLDIEPSRNTYECMLKIPFDKYKFRVITYEHDHYIDVTQSYREKSRKFLQEKGYILVANDISTDEESTFEDWWAYPDLVDQTILNIMTSTTNVINKIDEYMLLNLKDSVENNLMRLENKKFTYPKDFEWADLTEEDIVTIDREIVNENVYRFWEDVKEGDIVLDIGSSVGAYTISILDQKPKKVYCIEPSKNLLETSIRNCSKKLSNSPHTEIIYINNGIVQNNNDYINIFGHDKNFIPITFKKLIKKYSISFINYMKIDCEGGEYNIFNDDNIEFISNNVEFISMEIHLRGKNFREKFKNFRDKYLLKFKNYKVMSCTRQNISWGKSIDITHMIFDDNFINEYNCEFMIYINNKKYDR